MCRDDLGGKKYPGQALYSYICGIKPHSGETWELKELGPLAKEDEVSKICNRDTNPMSPNQSIFLTLCLFF